MNGLITVAIVLGGAMALVAPPVALTQDDPYAIHVESNEVLVPARVYDKDLMGKSREEKDIPCERFEDQRFEKLRPDQPYMPEPCSERGEIRFLTANDFHVFEDGVEQRIQRVRRASENAVVVRDNYFRHAEFSRTPTGKWISSDFNLSPFPVRIGGGSSAYVIAYVPSQPSEGKCHRLKVKVDRPNSFVYYRDQYCYVLHAPSDYLSGTKLGNKMQGYAQAGKPGKIPLSLQSTFVYSDASTARVGLALQFSWKSLSVQRSSGYLYATIAVLGLVYRNDGSLAAHFSDCRYCSDSHVPEEYHDSDALTDTFVHDLLDVFEIPSGYETELNLAPGDYELRVVLSDGSKFGLVKVPLSIDPYDGKQLAISSVALCKRFRNAAVAAEEAADAKLAPDYVPLVSEGVRYAPTGDTTFLTHEPLFAYFEVYEPLLTGTSPAAVQTQLKITDVKSGELKVNTGLRGVADWIQPGKSVAHIAEQIAVDKLPVGSYRLEVQATDSAGKSTAWRAANFTVE